MIDFNKIAARSNTCVLDIGQIYSIIIANKGCRKEVDQICFDAIETSSSATTTIESVDEVDQICFDAIETSTSAATIESVGVSKSSILKLIEEMTLLKDQSFAIKTIAKNIQGGRYYKARMSFGFVELKGIVVFSHETFGSVELKGTVVFSHETMSSTSSVQEVAEAVERPRLQTYHLLKLALLLGSIDGQCFSNLPECLNLTQQVHEPTNMVITRSYVSEIWSAGSFKSTRY